jgi:hypothetical protein
MSNYDPLNWKNGSKSVPILSHILKEQQVLIHKPLFFLSSKTCAINGTHVRTFFRKKGAGAEIMVVG